MKYRIGNDVTIDTCNGRFDGYIDGTTNTTLPALYRVRYRKDGRLFAAWASEKVLDVPGPLTCADQGCPLSKACYLKEAVNG